MIKVKAWLNRKDENSVIKSLALFLYAFFVNPYIQALTHTIAAVVLGAFFYKGEGINYGFIVPAAIVYLILIILFAVCNNYRAERAKLLKRLEKSNLFIAKSLKIEFNEELKLFDKVKSKNSKNIVEKYKEHDLFSEACQRVCINLNELLEDAYTCNKFSVMIFVREIKEKKDYYELKCYAPLNRNEPEIVETPFNIQEMRFKHANGEKIPAHAVPFIAPKNDVMILLGKGVEDSYVDFHSEQPTMIHIGIPCSIKKNVMFCIQITSYDDCMGKKEDIKEFVENTCYIFSTYLKMVYMQQKNYELLANAAKKLGGNEYE